MFRRIQAEISHQLARAFEPAEAADLGDDHCRHDQRHAAQSLDRLNDRRQRPVRHQIGDRRLEPVAQRLSPLDPQQHLLVRQMLGRMGEGQFAEPAAMGLGPMAMG